MVLRYKTIKLMEEIAERLEKWAKEWGKRLLKDKPNNVRQIRESLLASLRNTDFPHLTFKIEFRSGVNEALEGFDYVMKELSVNRRDSLTNRIDKGHEDLIHSVDSVTKLDIGSCDWLRKVNNSRSYAVKLAEDLRHKAKLVRKEGKRRIVKLIFYVTSAVVVFLAALLTIFYYLGWLEQIKAFINNILRP